MSFSAFDVIGPPMVGPSSSHTAGAVRLGLVSRALAERSCSSARIELHGSFAATGHGHATDRAIVAGLLGFRPDDERLKDSLALAENAGLQITFAEIDLGEDAHPNSVRIWTETLTGESHVLVGSSVGGGQICVNSIDGFNAAFAGDRETILLWHDDHSGYLARLTAFLAADEVNIATIRTSRKSRGTSAFTVVEIDTPLTEIRSRLLAELPASQRLRQIHPLP